MISWASQLLENQASLIEMVTIGRPPKGIKIKNGYIIRRTPEHPKADNRHYVPVHRLVYEHYLSILFDEEMIIPDDYHVHHINKDRKDNRLINLELLHTSDHTSHHNQGNTRRLGKHQDTSYRKCFECGSKITYIQQPYGNLKTPMPIWYHLPNDKTNWYCQICYARHRNRGFVDWVNTRKNK